jgi:hypothetical protein
LRRHEPRRRNLHLDRRQDEGGAVDVRRHFATNEGVLRTAKTDRTASLDALHALELDAGRAGPGRQAEWVSRVRGALEGLRLALSRQSENSLAAESVLSAIEREQPRLRPKIHQLRRRYRAIADAIDHLDQELRSIPPDAIDIADIRQTVDLLATELRYQRTRESDLVYEAFSLDLGEGD